MSAVTFVQLALAIMFIVPGSMALWVSYKAYPWFFQRSLAQLLKAYMGQRGVRAFYAILGTLLIACGLWGIWYVGTHGVAMR